MSFFSAWIATILKACSHTGNEFPSISPNDRRTEAIIESEFNEVERLHYSGANFTAVNAAENFLKKHPDSRFRAQVLGIRGNLEKRIGNYLTALNWFDKALSLRQELSSANLNWILIRRAEVEMALDKRSALKRTVSAIHESHLNSTDRITYDEIKAKINLWDGKELAALAIIQQTLTEHHEVYQRFHPLLEEILEQIKEPQPLLESYEKFPNSPFSEQVLYDAILRLFSIDMRAQAISHARRYLRTYPNGTYVGQIRKWVQDEKAKVKENEQTIGLLIPKEGKLSELGTQIQTAIEIGLESKKIRIITEDPGSSDAQLVAAFERLVKNRGAISVVGPISNKGSPAVALRAEQLGVPTLLLSRENVMPNSFGFQLGVTLQHQVQTITELLQSQIRTPRFALVGPKTPKGQSELKIIWDTIEKAGGKVQAYETYEPAEKNFQDLVAQMTGMTDKEGRSSLGSRHVHILPTEDQKGSNQYCYLPVIDFDAIWIADDAIRAKAIIGAMEAFKIQGPRIFGSMIWNNPKALEDFKTLSTPVQFADLPPLDAPSSANRKFKDQFRKITGIEPTSIHALAYDAGAILSKIIDLDDNQYDRQKIRKSIIDFGDFIGITGKIHFFQEGTSRPLKVYSSKPES